jgi:hypothetical protein
METDPEAAPHAEPKGLPLEQPIKRGETQITHLTLRKPGAGELRGLQLQALLQGDVNGMLALLPRIALPQITAPEAEQLSLADLAALVGEVQGFFMTKGEQAMLAKVMGAIEPETSTA